MDNTDRLLFAARVGIAHNNAQGSGGVFIHPGAVFFNLAVSEAGRCVAPPVLICGVIQNFLAHSNRVKFASFNGNVAKVQIQRGIAGNFTFGHCGGSQFFRGFTHLVQLCNQGAGGSLLNQRNLKLRELAGCLGSEGLETPNLIGHLAEGATAICGSVHKVNDVIIIAAHSRGANNNTNRRIGFFLNPFAVFIDLAAGEANACAAPTILILIVGRFLGQRQCVRHTGFNGNVAEIQLSGCIAGNLVSRNRDGSDFFRLLAHLVQLGNQSAGTASFYHSNLQAGELAGSAGDEGLVTPDLIRLPAHSTTPAIRGVHVLDQVIGFAAFRRLRHTVRRCHNMHPVCRTQFGQIHAALGFCNIHQDATVFFCLYSFCRRRYHRKQRQYHCKNQ